MKPATNEFTTRSTHVRTTLGGITSPVLNRPRAFARLLREACTRAGAHVLSTKTHTFDAGNGQVGIATVCVLSESHASAHTWPEHQAVLMDIFTCGDCDPAGAMEWLAEQLGATYNKTDVEVRGLPEHL